jgi:hypothetical protein
MSRRMLLTACSLALLMPCTVCIGPDVVGALAPVQSRRYERQFFPAGTTPFDTGGFAWLQDGVTTRVEAAARLGQGTPVAGEPRCVAYAWQSASFVRSKKEGEHVVRDLPGGLSVHRLVLRFDDQDVLRAHHLDVTPAGGGQGR